MAGPKAVYVSKATIRDAFNKLDFTEKLKNGSVSARLEGREQLAPEHLGFPKGTKSRRMRYVGGNGKTLAIVHEYPVPGGGLAASGRPDPKSLLVENELWIVDPADKSP
jgi:hypothetical protein